MLFPIADDNKELEGPAYVTWTLMVLNIIVFFLLQGAGGNEAFTYGWSAVPQEITSGVDLIQPETMIINGERQMIPQEPGPFPIYLTLLSSMFMHGGFMHLFGNLLYLWIFGDNVEHRFGMIPFLVFYLISGLAASFAQIFMDPDSIIPTLGASGAISGVMGAYLVLFPKNKVRAILLYFVVSVPAVVAIGLWIIMQFVGGWGSLVSAEQSAGGVAYAAHIGGFVAGLVLAMLMRGYFHNQEPPDPFEQLVRGQSVQRYW